VGKISKTVMASGDYRRAFIIGNFVLKVPRLRNLTSGIRCNKWEREMWLVWRPKFLWENLCPIVFADKFGMFVLMHRATQPVTLEEIKENDRDYYPDITAEYKPSDWGWFNGMLVAVDYGLPDLQMINDRRNSYSKTQNA
jgi:hypothetical protein